jgi:ABC-type phosphate/phosphonate transport system substrate-binding protein
MEKIRAALIKLGPNTPQAESVLGPAKLNGFVPVSDKDYDNLRKAASVAGAI